jgi:hypothetical protein
LLPTYIKEQWNKNTTYLKEKQVFNKIYLKEKQIFNKILPYIRLPKGEAVLRQLI